MDFPKDRIGAASHILASIFASLNALRVLAPEHGWRGLGNILGDFGELVAADHYGLTKAPRGSGDFDARTPDGRSVQIKTNHAADQIGFRGEADLLLVIAVDEDGAWSELYYGPFLPVRKAARHSARDNKWMIPVAKLRRMQPSSEQVKAPAIGSAKSRSTNARADVRADV